jgi:hypothetical protein
MEGSEGNDWAQANASRSEEIVGEVRMKALPAQLFLGWRQRIVLTWQMTT